MQESILYSSFKTILQLRGINNLFKLQKIKEFFSYLSKLFGTQESIKN